MAIVHFSMSIPAADGITLPATGSIRFTPTARRVVTGAPDEVVLPKPFHAPLVAGVVDVTLAPTTGAWAWRVDEFITGAPARTVYVAVPDVAEVDYPDLVTVDPATLLPDAVPAPIWETQLANYATGAVHFIVSDTAPTETEVNGRPVVWIDTSTTTTPTADTTAPSAVTGLTAGTATTTTVPLSWTAATDNVGVAGYEYSTNGTTYTSTGSTGTSYTVTGLTAGTAYTLYVRAFDAAGNRGTAASVAKTTAASADTTAPSAVTGLAAGTPTSSTIPLTWTAATDNVAVTGYEYTTNGTTWVSTGSTATSYTVTGLTASTAYTVQVRAFDAAGNKGASASVTATTAAAADTTAPTAPTNLAGTAGTTTMDLSWTASTDAVGVTGYRVSKDNGATWITSAVTGTTYQVTGLTASTSYTFAVAARDADGNWSTNATLTKSTNAAAVFTLPAQDVTEDFAIADGAALAGKTTTTGGLVWEGTGGSQGWFSNTAPTITGQKVTLGSGRVQLTGQNVAISARYVVGGTLEASDKIMVYAGGPTTATNRAEASVQIRTSTGSTGTVKMFDSAGTERASVAGVAKSGILTLRNTAADSWSVEIDGVTVIAAIALPAITGTFAGFGVNSANCTIDDWSVDYL